MKKQIILIALCILLLCGCNKDTKILNEFEIKNNPAISYITDTDLTKAEGFASDLAVVPLDCTNSENSDKLYSEAALLVDATTGEILFQKNPHKREYPASTTKVLTALLAIKYGDVNSTVTVGSEEITFYEDNVVICDYRVGDEIPFDIALHGALMVSGNDAAGVLARFARNDLSDFADLMNEEVKALGATNSHFVNPHGLYNDNHYTTAYDLYLIYKEAIKFDYFINAVNTKSYTNTFKRTTTYSTYQIPCAYTSSVPFFTGVAKAPEHIEIIGGKSGYTEVARRSYVLHARANDHDYICVVMKSDSYDYMCADLTYLLSYIPDNL